MSGQRLCIATLDPELGGGVSALARFVYDAAEQAGYDPYLAFNQVDLSTDVRPWEFPLRGTSVAVEHTRIDGREAKYTSRVLPEFEFLHYVLNSSAWERLLADADLYFGVSGNNQCCHPFSREGVPFGCWVATLLWEDREDRIENSSMAWRVRDRLSKPLLESIEGRIYDDADPIFALSTHTADAIASKYGVDRDAIDVVHYPIDTERFTPRRADSNDPPAADHEGTLDVLFAGRLNDPRKNTRMLLRAFQRTRSAVDDATLRVIGGDPDPDLVADVEAMGIADSVEFTGYVPGEDLPQVYRDADVFAIPSYQEGLGIVGLEAMACGTPVVATRCGGPEDYVRDGENGFLVPIDDADAMATALVKLLGDHARRHEFGERARRLVEAEFQQAAIEDRFLDAFDRLANSS